MSPHPAAPTDGPRPFDTHSPQARSPRAAWLVVYALLVLLLLLRIPVVVSVVRSRVDGAIATGVLEDSSQRMLAVNIGVATAVTLTLTVVTVVLAVSRRVEPRLGLPEVPLGRVAVPGTLLIVGGVLVAKQAALMAFRPAEPTTSVTVWGAVLAVMVGCLAVVARAAHNRASVVRTIAVSLAVGACAVVI